MSIEESVTSETRIGTVPVRRRVTIAVEIDLDPVPGFGDSAASWKDYLQKHLDGACPWYHPTVLTLNELMKEYST